MRKVICALLALLLCLSVAAPAFAADVDFVPSIEYKDGPTLGGAELDDIDVTGCVVITTIEDAVNGTTDISPEERALLLDLYKKLSDSSDPMKLPLDYDYTILELVDISFKFDDCVNKEDHGDKEDQLGPDNKLTVNLDVNIPKDAGVAIHVYVDGEWQPVEDFSVNEDGSLTVNFDNIGPVAISVREGYTENPPQTGDQMGNSIVLWVALLAVSAVALVAVIVLSKRKAR